VKDSGLRDRGRHKDVIYFQFCGFGEGGLGEGARDGVRDAYGDPYGAVRELLCI